MADNLQINEGTSGKFARAIEKVAGIFTGLFQLDIGAGTTETRLVAGQAAMSASIPVTIANNQSAVPTVAELHSVSGSRWCATAVVTATTDTTIKAATGGLKHSITHLSMTNDSNVFLRAALYDGASAGGAKLGEWLLPPGGGVALQSTSGWLNAVVNTALILKLSAAPNGTVPSGGTAAVLVSATGYTGA